MAKTATAKLSAKSTNISFKDTYATGYCIPLWLRDEQIKASIRKVPGRIKSFEGERTEPIAVVGYGPSLKKTWEEIKNFKYIITTSGAHKFLIEKGIIPTWHLDVDPRPHKVELLGDIHPDVTYLPCSTQHPNYLEKLVAANAKIELWHTFSTDAEAMRVLPPGEYALTGGCDAGMRAMAVARFLGFKDQHIFGMDGCADAENKGHADFHSNGMKKFFDLEYPEGSGVKYRTAPNLMEVSKTVPHEVDMLKLDSIKFYGDGLVQAIMRDHKPRPPQQSNIAFIKPVLITDEYKELNRKLHDKMPEYGTGGQRHAQTIIKMCEQLKTTSVLDYGCGKGTLAVNIPFPIWEYDPAVPGKDAQPRPADIVVCTDVLEHIEPEKLSVVLSNIASLTQKVAYLVIATRAAKKTLEDGRNAHLIQQNTEWWKKKLSKYFNIGQLFEHGMDEIQVVVGPKTKGASTDVIQAVERNGVKAKFHTPNDTTKWRVNTLFKKEPVTIEWLEAIKPGKTLYDIGANMGGYSIWAGVHGVKVLAFEPESGNYSLLCRNMTLNNVDGSAYCMALSDRTQFSSIYLATQEPGGSCNSFGEEVGFDLRDRKGIKQGCIGFALDNIAGDLPYPSHMIGEKLPFPDHIKIDVDGFEFKVINGMKGILESGKVKSLLIEVNPNLPEHMEMIAYLDSIGYTYDKDQFEKAQRKEGAFKGCGECIFTKPNSVENYVLDKIRNAPVCALPFPHLYIEDVFPEGFKVELPEDGYQTLEEARGTKGYPDRYVHPAPAVVDWMRSGKLRAALDAKFCVKSSADETCLLRDKPGYSISPHTDTPRKVVTALFYLNPEWTEAEHGTTVYEPLIKDFTDKEGMHHSFEGFREVWTAPGKPNSVFIFARTDNSFHGAKPYKGTATRDILLFDTKK